MEKTKKTAFNILRGTLILFAVMALFNLIVILTASEQRMKISTQDTYTSEGSGGCQVSVVSQKNTKPLQAKVKINLLNDKKRFVKKLFEGKTDETGVITANFQLPKVNEGEYYLEVRAASREGSDKQLNKITVLGVSSANRVTISLDKPLYKPGDEINFRALMTNVHDDKPVKTDAKVSIFDGNENQVYSKTLSSSEYGIISGKFPLADEVNSGTYKLKVETGKTSAEKVFEVKPFVLPKFKVTIDTDKKEYIVGEKINGKVRASYFFGEPVKGGKVILRMNDKSQQEAALNEAGEGQFTYSVNSEGPQAITAAVTDSSNYRVEEAKTVFAGKDKIMVKLVPENKELVPGVQNEVFVFTTKLDGTPVKTYITLTGDKTKEISTDENGIAKFTVEPDYVNSNTEINIVVGDTVQGSSAQIGDKYNIDAKVVDESGNLLKQERFTLPVSKNNAGLIVRPDKPLYQPNEKISLNIQSNLDGAVTQLYVTKNGQILKMINAAGDSAELDLPKDTYGLIDIYAEKQGNFKEYRGYYSPTTKANTMRSIFIKPDKKMTLTINKDNRAYKPGEDLELTFNAKDENNNPLNSAIMLSIADEALMALKNNDMSLDNLRLALSGIEFRENINGLDLYTAVLNNADPTTLTGLLIGREANYPGLKESNYDSLAKKEKSWRNFWWWILGTFILLFVFLGVQFRWFRFAVLHFIGYIIVLIIGIFLVRPDDIIRLLVTAIVAIFFYIMTVNFAASKSKEENTLANPVTAGITIALLVILAFFAGVRYIMPMFDKNMALSDMATGSLDQLAGEGFSGGPGGFDIDAVKGAVQNSARTAGDGEAKMSSGIPNPFEGLFSGSVDRENTAQAPPQSNTAQQNQKAGQKQKDEYAEIKKLRMKFLESMYFNPEIIAQNGEAKVKVALADNITSWNIQAVGNSLTGHIGSQKGSVKVFQDFFVDFELPRNLTAGDEVSIPVTVFNYLKNAQQVKINVQAADWFTLLEGNDKQINIGANQQQLVYVPIKVNKFGDFAFRVNAYGQTLSDAVEKSVRVYPDGYKIETVCTSGRIDKKADENVFFLDKDIEGTRKVKIKVYPTPMAQVVEGLENILRFPSGCFEQTSSSLYPDILVLKYLRDSKKSNPEIEAKATGYIEEGFQKLLTYEVKGERGGFSLFGHAPAETVLTAYGIMEFNDLKEVYPVDPNIINRMKEFIFSKQNFDGSFKFRGGYGEHLGGASSSDTLALNAYIGWALSEACKDDPRLNKTVEYLKKKAFDTKDNYTLALIANVLVNVKDKEAKKVLDKLVNNITLDGEQKAYLTSSIRDYYGSYGDMQSLQTTALASIALSNYKAHPKTNKQFISYIISKKDPSGTFGSTQATILALKALVANSASAQPRDDIVKIKVNGVEDKIELKADNFLTYYQKEFSNLNKDNTVTLEANTDLSYEIVKEHYVPYDQAKTGEGFDIVRTLNTSVKVNDEVVEKIKITNRQQGVVENLMVVVQVPQGFTVEQESLEALKNKNIIEKYEMRYDRINLYLRSFQTSEFRLLEIKMRAGYPVKVTTGAVHVYDYYNPGVEAKLKPVNMRVDK